MAAQGKQQCPLGKRRRTCKGPDTSSEPLARTVGAGLFDSMHENAMADGGMRRRRRAEGQEGGRATSCSSSSSSPCLHVNAAMARGVKREMENEDGKGQPVVQKIIELHTCPITQQVLVDPVIAQDGHTYERRSLERWLLTKKSSPKTSQPMGSAVTPAFTAKQTVCELAEQSLLGEEAALQFFSSRGRLRATRTVAPGPDLEGARSDLAHVMSSTASPAQRRTAQFQLRAVAWMRQGADLAAEMQKVYAEAGREDSELLSWMLSFGDATRVAITRPMLRGARLTEWRPLPEGTAVSVIDDESELKQLCERCPTGARKEVGWNPEMLGYVGKVCVVQRTGDAAHKSYALRCVKLPTAQRAFAFPYDALFLLGGSS